MAATVTPTNTGAAVKAKEAGDAVVSAARRAPAGALAAGAAAAGLAGGLVLGARVSPRRGFLKGSHKVVGVALGRRHRPAGTAKALAVGVRRAASVAGKATSTAEDIRAIRTQLEQANRRSPIEIVLDGLTHRRGAHKLET